MFTLKFMKTLQEGQKTVFVSVKSFSHEARTAQSFDVVADGLSYRIGELEGDFDHCYVENQAGKTIAHFSRYSGKKNGFFEDVSLAS